VQGLTGTRTLALAVTAFGLLAARYRGLRSDRVSEQRRLQRLGADLERETQLRRATLELSRTGVCVIDGSGATAFGNSAWLALGRDAFPDVADAVLEGEAVRHEQDGRVLAFSAARLQGGETVLTVDDVTREERERASRDRFLAEVVRAQDMEARRVAELLHDDAVQQLTALSLRLELASMQRGDETLASLSRDAASITAAIRRLLVDLHPAVLESRGLGAAVESLAERMRALDVDVEVTAFDHRLPPELEQLAYRAVQEAVSNVVKHASAGSVRIALALGDGVLECSVDDDGVGAQPDDVDRALGRGSLGLHLVRERVELAGGRFSVGLGLRCGTRFAFELPVPAGVRTRPLQEVHA
jgi:signal transduction histidine kinase